jgi:hypothetical protein
MTVPPVLLVHLFTNDARTQILKRLKAGKRPRDTEVFLGRYGINAEDSEKISAVPGVFYAPTFHLSLGDTKDVRKARSLPERDAKKVDQALNGAFPASPNELLPASNPRAWGVELGRRFRDQLRQKQKGHKIAAWQLDEIPPKCVTSPRAKDFRLFVGGVVRGLAEGRPKLGDKVLPGFVWISAVALEGRSGLPGLPRLSPKAADVKVFWEDVNAGARCLVGEEYPRFAGSATATGTAMAGPQKALAAPGSPARQALAKRYIVGMTPGFHEPFTPGLNGNVGGMSLKDVTAWRNEFITARTNAQRPVGYGMFSFNGDFDTAPVNIDNAMTALHFAAKKHVEP